MCKYKVQNICCIEKFLKMAQKNFVTVGRMDGRTDRRDGRNSDLDLHVYCLKSFNREGIFCVVRLGLNLN